MKIGVLIGRFQVPTPHEGHRFLINRITEQVDKLIILVGSANRPRSPRNPFSFVERKCAILGAFNPSITNKLEIYPLNDYTYNDPQWMSDVYSTITHALVKLDHWSDDITLFGHFKEGNDYLKWFPNFKYQEIDSDVETSGTEMRNANRKLLPLSVQEDMEYTENEQKKFSNYPYPECLNIMCSDVVLECLGHVLLVRRGKAPGRGTWALPGGHKEKNETSLDCALRELQEETNVRVPEKVLRGSIKSTRLFDSPGRSYGFTRTSYVVHIVVQPNPDGSLPRANGGDDASDTRWATIYEALNMLPLYDDHSDIIRETTGVCPVPAYMNPHGV